MFFIIFSRVEVIVESTSSSIWIEKRFIHSFVFWSYWLKFKFILFSFQFICGNSVLLIVLIDFCACGTIQERPRGPTANTQTQKGNKKIMNPAFANAGQGKGLEIWRIEVSLILLFIGISFQNSLICLQITPHEEHWAHPLMRVSIESESCILGNFDIDFMPATIISI